MILPPLVFPVKTNEIWNSFNECERVRNRTVKLEIIKENVATKKYTILQDIYSFGNPASLGNAAMIKSTNSCSMYPFSTLTTWS